MLVRQQWRALITLLSFVCVYSGDFDVFLSMLQGCTWKYNLQLCSGHPFWFYLSEIQWILFYPHQHFHTGAKEYVITFISFHLFLSCSSSSHDLSANKPQWTLRILFFSPKPVLESTPPSFYHYHYIRFILHCLHISLIHLTPKFEILRFLPKVELK